MLWFRNRSFRVVLFSFYLSIIFRLRSRSPRLEAAQQNEREGKIFILYNFQTWIIGFYPIHPYFFPDIQPNSFYFSGVRSVCVVWSARGEPQRSRSSTDKLPQLQDVQFCCQPTSSTSPSTQRSSTGLLVFCYHLSVAMNFRSNFCFQKLNEWFILNNFYVLVKIQLMWNRRSIYKQWEWVVSSASILSSVFFRELGENQVVSIVLDVLRVSKRLSVLVPSHHWFWVRQNWTFQHHSFSMKPLSLRSNDMRRSGIQHLGNSYSSWKVKHWRHWSPKIRV